MSVRSVAALTGRVVAGLAVVALGSWDAAGAATWYVDGSIPRATCADYDPPSRSCGPGAAIAHRSLSAFADPAASAPGDVVLVRAGVYGEALAPAVSGLPGLPITYRSFPGEVATLTGPLDPAIALIDVSWIVLKELSVDGVTAWLRADGATDCVIRNCTFTRATAGGSRASVKLVRSMRNRVIDCVLDDGNDNLQLIHSDHNVVSGNRISRARHNLWSILCGNENVIRGNWFHNAVQKIGQVTDCEGVPSDATVSFDDTRRNLIEGNEFVFTPSSGNASPYAGIQYAGQRGLVRRNVLRDTIGPGLDLTLYDQEARFNYGNRVYHNVFVRSEFAGISLASDLAGTSFDDNAVVNNALDGSRFVANDTRWSWYTSVLEGEPVQILSGRLDGFLFERNLVWGGSVGAPYAITYGQRWSTTNPPPRSLSAWELTEPALFRSNLEADPLFVDPGNDDFHPAAGSPLIDAGRFLTAAIGEGSGIVLPVADAGWFQDGFGIPGEVGDTIQLQGRRGTAIVTVVDLGSNTLGLDRPVRWSDGQGVSLAFSGAGPDIGAFEDGLCSPPPPVIGLLARKLAGAVEFTWSAASDPDTQQWNLYQVLSGDPRHIPGANADADPADVAVVPGCTDVPRATTGCIDPVPVPMPGSLLFFQVRAACSDGTEGTAHPGP